MPTNLTYPGVYIEELPSLVRTIVGVPTAVAAFVGRALRGPVDDPRHITSWADFERIYGGIWSQSPMSYSVFHFFQNGGGEAEVVRIHKGGTPATLDLKNNVTLEAKYPGAWGSKLRARVDYHTMDPTDTNLYNLAIRDTGAGTEERYLNVSIVPGSNTLDKVLQSSRLVKSTGAIDHRPDANSDVEPGKDPFADPDPPPAPGTPGPFTEAEDGGDGDAVTGDEFIKNKEASKSGIYALLKTDIFNLLCIPPMAPGTDPPADVLSAALKLCSDRRAMLLVDPPSGWTDVASAVAGAANFVTGDDARNAALYFPRVTFADPASGHLGDFVPSGAIAGVMARTDAQRGVWKAPAGTEASINGAQALTVPMTDLENGQLNPLGVNCLRNFPLVGTVVWGARTRRGADRLADQWKYVPVRRVALFIEESLFRGTQWVVFEPNDEPLWAQIRLNVGAFMQNLFRQGAFQGTTPQEAYFVKCDKETTTQNDINLGIVNIVVGFAPLKPAEFVVIKIQQMAGQIAT